MQVPLDITFENSEPSDAIRSEIERQAKRLEKFSDRITSCNVAVITPQTRHQKGGLFKIDIRIAMPDHKNIIVTKTHRRRARARACRRGDQGCIRRGSAPDRGTRSARCGVRSSRRSKSGKVDPIFGVVIEKLSGLR